MVVAFTDIVTISIVIGVMLILDLIGYKTQIGLMYLSAGLLGLFTAGWTFTNQSVTYMVAYNAGTNSFSTYTVDANIIVVVITVLTIVSFIFLYLERYADA